MSKYIYVNEVFRYNYTNTDDFTVSNFLLLVKK